MNDDDRPAASSTGVAGLVTGTVPGLVVRNGRRRGVRRASVGMVVVVATFGVSSWKLCVFVNLICCSRLPALQLTPLPLNTSVNRTHALTIEPLERARGDRAVDELLLRLDSLAGEREERGRVFAVRPLELRDTAHREVRARRLRHQERRGELRAAAGLVAAVQLSVSGNDLVGRVVRDAGRDRSSSLSSACT